MRTATAYEAKTHFSDLLRRAQRGESITITKHGVPVATLGPAKPGPEMSVDEVISEIRKLRKGLTLEGITIKELIEEGRM
jgi:prevent-host-death family protein